jgi:hypothetical protein
MLASEGRGEPTRYERARAGATELQRGLGDIPVGLASFTDRVLPHLFPTVDERVFRDTAVNSIGDRAAASLDVVRYERDDARHARGRA